MIDNAMTTNQKLVFNKLWNEIKKNINYWCKSSEGVNIAIKILIPKIAEIEKREDLSILSYTLIINQDNPKELVTHLLMLKYLTYDFHVPYLEAPPFLLQICQLPNPLPLLNEILGANILQILKMNCKNNPSYLNAPTAVLDFLFQNYDEIFDVHPLLWPIINEDIELIDKIFNIKPDWIHANILEDYTPLMIAVYFYKKNSLLKLIEYPQDVYQTTPTGKNIAHLACHSADEKWLCELLNDSRYEALQIADMLFDFNPKSQHPCVDAFEKGHYTSVNMILKKAPYLRNALIVSYKHAIEHQQLAQLELLYNVFEVDIFAESHHEYLIHLLEKFFHHAPVEIAEWFLNHPHMNPTLQSFLKIYHAALNKDWLQVDTLFQNTSINWDDSPKFIPFSTTKLLIENHQTNIICQHQLFDLHPHFHHIVDNRNTYRTFFDFIDIQNNSNFFKTLHPHFAHYFLNFLERHAHDFPNWALSYHEYLSYMLSYFPLNKNMRIQGQPLLHFLIRHYVSIYQLTYPWIEQLKQFIDESVDLNIMDDSGRHLFIQLVSEKDGFQVIQLLIKHFPSFRLEALDSNGSNILHLGLKQQNVDEVLWFLKNHSIDVCTQLITEQQSPLEMAFVLGRFDMVEIMRKKVKKNQFISFLTTLIQKQSTALIEYLLQFLEPFGWKFSEYHQKEIQKLKHPKMISTWTTQKIQAPTLEKQPEIIAQPTPSLISITADSLLSIIEKQHLKKLESLSQAEYQGPLAQIFEQRDTFFHFLELVFLATNKKINKSFIRIPEVQIQIRAHDAWHVLFLKGINQQNHLLLTNMLERETIRNTLQQQSQIYLEKIFYQNPTWFISEKLHTYFTLESHTAISMIQFCLEHDNIDTLSKLLELIPVTLLDTQTIHQLLSTPNINKLKYLEHLPSCYLHMTQTRNIDSLIKIHQEPELIQELLQEFEKIIPHIHEKDLPMLLTVWEPYLQVDDILNIFKYALRLPHESLVYSFLKNAYFNSILQTQARQLIQIALYNHPELWSRKLLPQWTLSIQDTYALFDFIHKLDDVQIYAYFVAFTPYNHFFSVLQAHHWINMLEHLKSNLLDEPQWIERIQGHLKEILSISFNETRGDILKLISETSQIKSKILEKGYEFLVDAIQKDKLSQYLDYFLSMASDDDWHQWFDAALEYQNIPIIDAFLCHAHIPSILQRKALYHYQLAFLNSPNAIELIKVKLELQNLEQIQLYKFVLRSQNQLAMRMFSQHFELSELFLTIEDEQDAIEIFTHGILEHQIAMCEQMLKNKNLKKTLYAHTNVIIEFAHEKECLNDLISLWEPYFHFKAKILPYMVQTQIRLPWLIIQCIQTLKQPNQALFLVGSAIHTILYNGNINCLNDIDFVSSHPPVHGLMIRSSVQPQLFFKTQERIKIECFINSKANPKHFIAEDFKNRDFTVNSLYADEQGYVYDPTGRGLKDLEQGLIRTINPDPVQCFHDDPARLIRAMKLLAKGFHLCNKTRRAISDWEATMDINFGHLYAMCHSLFRSQQGEKIFNLMKEYHLIRKLLKCDESQNFNSIKTFVMIESERHKFISLTSR